MKTKTISSVKPIEIFEINTQMLEKTLSIQQLNIQINMCVYVQVSDSHSFKSWVCSTLNYFVLVMDNMELIRMAACALNLGKSTENGKGRRIHENL